MDDRTLTALKGSIAKWERNTEAPNPVNYLTKVNDCPLCVRFWHLGCRGCPVYKKTGERNCYDSPYIEASKAHWEWLCKPFAEHLAETARQKAKLEVAFLESLLPAEGQSDA